MFNFVAHRTYNQAIFDADDVDERDMMRNRATWKGEIDEWLERLKAAETDLGVKEKELRRRELMLWQREKQLEEQFHVVVSISCFFSCIVCCDFVVRYRRRRFWHATPRLHSTIHRQHPQQRVVLSHICYMALL